MAIVLDGSNGLTTPGVVNTAGETIATTLAVTGVSKFTGNVAIGTATTPTAKLWVDSGRVGLTNTYKLGWHSNPAHGDLSNYITGDDATNYVAIATDSVEQLRIDSAGLLKFNSGYGSAATAYGCRAWVNFNGTGVVAIRASGNVSSITDVGVGDYTVNFTTAMVDTNYTVVTSAGRSSAADYGATTTDTPNVTTAINYSSWVNASPIRGDVPFNALAIFR